jgi:hypothetical protein
MVGPESGEAELTALLSTDGIVSLRTMRDTDVPYVLDVWIHGLQLSSGRYLVSKALEAVVLSSRVVVACLTDEPEALVGFAVAEPGHEVIRFASVRGRWRNLGVMEALVTSASEAA